MEGKPVLQSRSHCIIVSGTSPKMRNAALAPTQVLNVIDIKK
jgi:hypothetical protein